MVSLIKSGSEIYFPAGKGSDQQLLKTTHLGIGAHQDDLEILAIHGILKAYDDPESFFTGVTITNGINTSRGGDYQMLSDQDYQQIRNEEQKRASDMGKYNAQFLLNYGSEEIKIGINHDLIEDLKTIFSVTAPSVIYTHNLADRHPTHVAAAWHVIQAFREIFPKPKDVKLYGCEVWGSLDWLPEEKKISLACSSHLRFQKSLLAVYHSQISDNKNYDNAAIARRIANATFQNPLLPDKTEMVTFAMDLTPLIYNPEMNILRYVINDIQSFANEVSERLNRFKTQSTL